MSSAFSFTSSASLGASGAADFAFDAASSPAFGRGGSFGDPVALEGVALFALSVAPLAVDLGVLVADLVVSFA